MGTRESAGYDRIRRVTVQGTDHGTGDYHWQLIALDEDGKRVCVLGEDGGEPEDQTLVRDWDWVPKVINALLESRAAWRAQLIDEMRVSRFLAQNLAHEYGPPENEETMLDWALKETAYDGDGKD